MTAKPSIQGTSGTVYHVTAKENNTVILPCKVNGYPPPAVTWSKDGDVTAINKGLMTVNGLVLVDVHVGDTGNYTCKAESILGVQEKVVELIVKGIFYYDIYLFIVYVKLKTVFLRIYQ